MRTTSGGRARRVIAAGVVLLGAAACSGDDDDAAGTSAPVAAETTAPVSAVEVTTTTTAADATTTTGPDGPTAPTSLPPVGTDPVATTSTTLAPVPTTLAPAPSVDPLPPLVTAPPEISAGCLDGQWYVVGSDGGSADVTGIVGVQLSISKLEWALSAADALATVGTEDVTFDGTASGTVTIDGDDLTLAPSANPQGTVDGTLDWAALTRLLVPVGAPGTRSCSGFQATLDDGTTTVTLDRRAPVPPQAEGDPPIDINDNGGSDDIECRGRSFVMSGSGSTYTFLGSCPSIEVTGNSNSIAVEFTDSITISGDNNTMVYRGPLTGAEVDVEDSGSGNTVTQG